MKREARNLETGLDIIFQGRRASKVSKPRAVLKELREGLREGSPAVGGSCKASQLLELLVPSADNGETEFISDKTEQAFSGWRWCSCHRHSNSSSAFFQLWRGLIECIPGRIQGRFRNWLACSFGRILHRWGEGSKNFKELDVTPPLLAEASLKIITPAASRRIRASWVKNKLAPSTMCLKRGTGPLDHQSSRYWTVNGHC